VITFFLSDHTLPCFQSDHTPYLVFKVDVEDVLLPEASLESECPYSTHAEVVVQQFTVLYPLVGAAKPAATRVCKQK